MKKHPFVLLASVLGLFSAAAAESSPFKDVQYPCCYDNSMQPALVRFSPSANPRPLIVVLHTWSHNYKGAAPYIQEVIQYDFHMIAPDFRGTNKRKDPLSMGSDAAVSDIVSAVNWMKKQCKVDEKRIYLLGGSGGGHMALLLAGRHPEIWAGVSAWCPISDIKAWCAFHNGKGYGKDIIDNIGGDPRTDAKAAEDAAKRSPLTYLANAKHINIDIATGIHDGHTGSVPISEAFNAFNKLADEKDAVPQNDIKLMTEKEQVPTGTPAVNDPGFGSRKVHYRKISNNTRITIFEGGHDILPAYGYAWLNQQKKGAPANWKTFSASGTAAQLTK